MIVIKKVRSLDVSTQQKSRFTQTGWLFLLVFSVFIYGSHAPLITLCKVDGKVPFSPSSCVVLIEVTKLLISLGLLLIQDLHSLQVTLSWGHMVPYAFPAVLYAINNNLVVYMQLYMDPSTFQVLSNLKIISTALLYSLFLNKHLLPVQWWAVCLLMMAGVCHTYSSLDHTEEEKGEAVVGTQFHISVLGLVLVLSYCFVSGLAAVYTELILKTQRLPLNLQNLFLYVFGVAVNCCAHFTNAGPGFFEGYSWVVWLIVTTQALNGLFMSLVMKHSSNITRLFVISCSMLVNAVLSVSLFSLQLTPLFFVSVVLIGLAIYLYYHA
ncbi:probable UDP-sugar transporter protein SLC35A4 [Lepisosteus oculatus]|uniref:probable UDP-sugar transporter protein SLC35A4 n=1 Tax=Lepisosteus oculatus TaxID=7918 RepID=UPI0035F52DC4